MYPRLDKILVIQTAFIGDAILATSLVSKIQEAYPQGRIDVLVRKGNEQILANNPNVIRILTWDKSRKWRSWFDLLFTIRRFRYDAIFNLQRFFSMTLLTVLSKSKLSVGFSSHVLSRFYSHRIPHHISPSSQSSIHEVQRNIQLLYAVNPKRQWGIKELKPQLFTTHMSLPPMRIGQKNIAVAPFSVWKTKAWPLSSWSELIDHLVNKNYHVYLLGASSDSKSAHLLMSKLTSRVQSKIVNTCGDYNLLQSAKLLEQCDYLIANDSAPLHLASAVNCPTIAIFCSTVPEFGFGPLADKSHVLEVKGLDCRPCGIHGKSSCPLHHFRCGYEVSVESVLKKIL